MGRPCNCCGYYSGRCLTCENGPETLTAQLSVGSCGGSPIGGSNCSPSVSSITLYKNGTGEIVPYQYVFFLAACNTYVGIDVRCYCRGTDQWRAWDLQIHPEDGYERDHQYNCTPYFFYEPPGTPVLISGSVEIYEKGIPFGSPPKTWNLKVDVTE